MGRSRCGRRDNGRTPLALLAWVDLQKIKIPVQMLLTAILWEEVVPQEKVPENLDDVHSHSEELIKVPHLRCSLPDT